MQQRYCTKSLLGTEGTSKRTSRGRIEKKIHPMFWYKRRDNSKRNKHEFVNKAFMLIPQKGLIRSIEWVKCDRMSKEEVPFKSIKITLSEEALTKVNFIIKDASFRSYSSGIEECIRVVYDLMQEIYSTIGDRSEPRTLVSREKQAEAFNRIIMRMARFTGRALAAKTTK